MRTPAVALVLFLALSIAGAQEAETAFRTFDVSLITTPRSPTPFRVLGTGDEFQDWFEEEPLPFLDGDMLVDYLLSTVEPEDWETDDAMIGIRGGRLFARNRPETLAALEAALKEIEAAAARRVLLTVKVYSLPVELYPGLGGPVPPEKLSEEQLLESGSTEAWPGVRASFALTNRVRLLRDFDVEIAEEAAIADPVTEVVEEGLAVDVVPHPTLSGNRVLLEVLVQRGTYDRPIRKLALMGTETGDLGELDLPVFRNVEAYLSAIVPSGEALEIPFVSDGRLLLVRIRPSILDRAAPDRLLDVGALCRPPHQMVVGPRDEDEGDWQSSAAGPAVRPSEEAEPVFGSTEELMDMVVSNVEPTYWEEASRIEATEGMLLTDADRAVRSKVLDFLVGQERELLRPVRLDLRVYSVDGSIPPGAGAGLDPEKARLRRAATVSTLPGRNAVILVGNTRNYVADYDVQVATRSRIADPWIQQSFEGLAADLVPHLSLDRSRIRLDLSLLLARRIAEEGPSGTGARYLGLLEKFSEKRVVLTESVELPSRGAYVIDAGPDPDGSGRRLALVIEGRVE